MKTVRGAAFLLFFATHLNTNAQLRFEPLVISSNRLQLVLLGNANQSYSIESSLNLSNWTPFLSGIASNGRLTFDGPLPGALNQYFRGRPLTTPSNINLTPVFATNITTSTMAAEDGSTATIYGTNGTTFTLIFPSNTVATPTTFTIVQVTNLTGLPLSGPLLGAVKISATDPEFFGVAHLRISFPTNIDRRRIVSFTAEESGANFSLTPDRVSTNFVTIPILQPGIYGSSIATTQEIIAASAPRKKSANAPSPSNPSIAQAPFPSAIVCFPAEVTEAMRIRNEIRAALRAVQSDIAILLAIERQRQLLGVESDTSDIFAQVGPMSCDFYRQHIEPHWPETHSNCSLTSVLLEASLGLERQMQLFGVPDNERCTANILSADLLCPAFKNCLEEVKLCCLSGHYERQRMIDIFTLIRQQQILGISGNSSLGCFDFNDDVTEAAIDACTPKTWVGALKISESGQTFERTVFVNGFQENTRDYRARYNGFVQDATENVIPGLGVMATINFDGSFFSRDLDIRYGETHNQCGTMVNLFRSETSANDSSVYIVNLSIQATNYSLSIGFAGKDHQFSVPAEEHTENVNTTGPGIGCTGMERITTSQTRPYTVGGPVLFGFTGMVQPGNTNVIQGGTNLHGFGGNLETDLQFDWNLRRVNRTQ